MKRLFFALMILCTLLMAACGGKKAQTESTDAVIAYSTVTDSAAVYHQYQSCNEILQGYVQASENDPDDVS